MTTRYIVKIDDWVIYDGEDVKEAWRDYVATKMTAEWIEKEDE